MSGMSAYPSDTDTPSVTGVGTGTEDGGSGTCRAPTEPETGALVVIGSYVLSFQIN